MKNHLLIYIFLSSLLFSTGYTVNGGVSYSVDTARQISFENISFNIDINEHKRHLIDTNFDENVAFMQKNKNKYKNRHNYKDRELAFFSNGSYTVTYKNNKTVSYYYGQNGKLKMIEFELKKVYPHKYIRYDINGKLDSVVLYITGKEQFIFDNNKDCKAHWIGQNCYNEKGELVLIRY